MNVKLGAAVTTKNTHIIDIALIPQDLAPAHEVRGDEVDSVLLNAIDTITTVMTHAAGGDDPFLLKESTVELNFALTSDGSISLGVEGEIKDEITHKLKIALAASR
jgi:hypothetical protein